MEMSIKKKRGRERGSVKSQVDLGCAHIRGSSCMHHATTIKIKSLGLTFDIIGCLDEVLLGKPVTKEIGQ